jgi:hypothetical protein
VSAPIVVVTRDATGQPVKIEWFEDERRAYAREPMLVHELNTLSNVWWFVSLRNTLDYKPWIEPLVERLTENPYANVDEFETHRWSEPGAPLEPIPGRAA